MTDVREMGNAEQLPELRTLWPKLLGQSPRVDFFHSLDWLEVYWKHYGRGQKLRVLIVTENGKAVGIVPLVVRFEWTKVGPFRVLTFPLDGWGSFYGPIGPDPEFTLNAALQFLQSTRRDWDLLELRWLDPSDPSRDWIGQAMQENGFGARRRSQDFIPITDVSGSWDDYWASRKSSWRSNCRRNEKKLAAKGNVEHVRYRPSGTTCGEDDPRWDLYEQCQRIANCSWQGSSMSGTTLSHDEVRPFLRDVHQAAVAAGCLDLNLLVVDGQPAAFSYNYHYRGYLSGLRLGFDPQHARCGVGTVLTQRMLQDSFQRDDHTFDFLPGSLSVKRNWQSLLRDSYQYSYYSSISGRAQALRLKRWISDRIFAPAISS